MQSKFFLLLLDEEILLIDVEDKKRYSLKEELKKIQQDLMEIFSHKPYNPLYLFVDRNHLEIQEEQLPSLWLWDRIRFLRHKRETWSSEKKLYKYRFFKQEGKTYLQWIQIAQNDSVMYWVSWLQSLSNPFGDIFFISLEAKKFLKAHLKPSAKYQMLIYGLSSQNARIVVFKEKRLLLFRPLEKDEDLRGSLHFLSREHPDLYENLYILNLIPGISCKLPNVTSLFIHDDFINFMRQQKRPIFSFNDFLWTGKKAMQILLFCFLVVSGIFISQGIHLKNKSILLSPKIGSLKMRIQQLNDLLKNKNIEHLKRTIAAYQCLQKKRKNCLKTIEDLSLILNQYHVKIENFTWSFLEKEELEIRFFIPIKDPNVLEKYFIDLVSSLQKAFHPGMVNVIEGPYNSASHESYKYPMDIPLPMVRLRITQS